jgi:hypothetical protein
VELQPQLHGDTQNVSARTWQPVLPEDCTQLSEARLQLHYAAQFAAAAGISFLSPQADDSHTNLEWFPALAGLFSRWIPAPTQFRLGVTPGDLTLHVVTEGTRTRASYKLHGKTIVDALQWVRDEIAQLGVDPSRYSLKRHYEIPDHDVAIGESFDASDRVHFAQITRWFSNGALIVNSLARTSRNASDVRCWPHHFDIATSIEIASDRTVSVGFEPGDYYYDEPYFYVSMKPEASAVQARMRPLWGKGTWHTDEWIGAVLPGSRLGSGSMQEEQVREFVDSAVSACRGLSIQS